MLLYDFRLICFLGSPSHISLWLARIIVTSAVFGMVFMSRVFDPASYCKAVPSVDNGVADQVTSPTGWNPLCIYAILGFCKLRDPTEFTMPCIYCRPSHLFRCLVLFPLYSYNLGFHIICVEKLKCISPKFSFFWGKL